MFPLGVSVAEDPQKASRGRSSGFNTVLIMIDAVKAGKFATADEAVAQVIKGMNWETGRKTAELPWTTYGLTGPDDVRLAHDIAKEMEVRDATEADITAMEAIYSTMENQPVASVVRNDFTYNARLISDNLDKLASYRVAIFKDQVIGFVSTRTVAGKPTSKIGLVDALYVDPAFAHNRVGTRLLEDAQQLLKSRDAQQAIIATSKPQLFTEKFCEAAGWSRFNAKPDLGKIDEYDQQQFEAAPGTHAAWRSGLNQTVFVKDL